ncbi:MAG TPA: family 78 glycoside hydrolase catalytic domain [Dysgonomonas sp.]|uniref:alpha-L-rhamnosidase n=2 Tax=unclassified Dysgonomonas TaxID=2630389 RepID=UPI0025C13FA9|nr:alpha-L-rhamnosidase [Dysgonomonas sp. UBA7698]HML66080.1 family 78 glycoside hydrolase catalytic domain [Dysgonomonas sp.]
MRKNILYFMILCVMLSIHVCKAEEKVRVADLRVENLINPLGLETTCPRFSWKLYSHKRNLIQEAYRVIVASSRENLNVDNGDLWDSRRVNSNETILIPYQGKQLTSRQVCFWKVQVWTNYGEIVSVDEGSWTMGLLALSDWKAKWIGLESLEAEGEDRKSGFEPKDEDDLRLNSETRLNARYMRKEIDLNKNIKNAVLYISGLGLYEAYLNGDKIGDQVLAPTPTDYTKRVPYNTFNVTSLLNKGKNTIGIILGNGRFFSMRIPWFRTFGLPQLLSQLEITYDDGTKETFVSDESWKVTIDGPIGSNNEFDGEEYDARKEMSGWNISGFNDVNWHSVELVKAPEGKLYSQENLNIKIMETINPVSIVKLSEDKYIVDMGQNMVGWVKLKVRGHAGDKIKMRFAELLKEDGNLYTDNLRGAKATDTYILKGGEEETWELSFVYHGFRYIEVTGFRDEPQLDNFEGKVIYDEMETTGNFETSNSTINQIYKNSYWGIRGNYRGMPTDCPQRDERMGWLGDRATGSHGESFIFDNQKLYAKWLTDIEDSQRQNGTLPDVAPNYWKMYTDDVTWPAAYFIIADMLYRQYGNDRPIIKHYDSFKRFLAYIQSNYMKDYIVTKDTFGDWCMPPESPEMIHSQDLERKTSGELLSTAFYYRLTVLMQKFAHMSGHQEDVLFYVDLAENVKTAFNKKFYNNTKRNYSNNTVTANVLAIMDDIAPDTVKKDVFKHVVDKTENEFKGHVSTGLIGIQWLMRCLTEYGRADIAYKIATNRTYPSWGYMIEKGATTIWELWNGDTADPAMNSANHVMLLGDLIIWYYEYLAGIKNADDAIGFSKLEMHPLIIGDLNYVKASYNSVRGLIQSHWQRNDGKFSWYITIPANCSAKVILPDAEGKTVTESGTNIKSVTDFKNITIANGQVVLEIGSGSYVFEIE